MMGFPKKRPWSGFAGITPWDAGWCWICILVPHDRTDKIARRVKMLCGLF